MAKFDGKYLKGTLGNSAFRQVGKEQIVQSKPGRGRVRQTQATKESGAEFGLASTSGRVIRQAFSYLYQQVYDGTLVNRLTGVLAEVIRSNTHLPRGGRAVCSGDISRLEGFELNSHAPLRNILLVRPQTVMDASGAVKVSLPAFNSARDLKWAPKATECRLRVMTIAFDFKEKRYRYLGEGELQVPRKEQEIAAQEWTFTGNVPEGCLLLAAISLEFYYTRQGIRISADSREYAAAELTGAFLSAEPVAGIASGAEQSQQGANSQLLTAGSQLPAGWLPMTLYAYALEKLQRLKLKQREKGRSQRQKVAGKAAAAVKTGLPEGWVGA